MIRTRALLVAMAALMALSFAAGTANALRSLSLSGTERPLTLNGTVTFEGEGLGEIICNTTFVKTLSAVIPKTSGTLMGRITDVRIAPANTCRTTGGIINLLEPVVILGLTNENLWRLFYTSILGTLPRITGVQIRIRSIQALLKFNTILGEAQCLYEGDIEALATINSGTVERLRAVEGQNTATLITNLNGGPCLSRAKFKASLTPLQTNTLTLL